MFRLVKREKTDISQFPSRVGTVSEYISDNFPNSKFIISNGEGVLPELINEKTLHLCFELAEVVSIPTPWVGAMEYKASCGMYFSPAIIDVLIQLELASTPEGLPEGAVHIGVNLWELEGEYITRTNQYWVKVNKLRVAELLSTEKIFLCELSEKEYAYYNI